MGSKYACWVFTDNGGPGPLPAAAWSVTPIPGSSAVRAQDPNAMKMVGDEHPDFLLRSCQLAFQSPFSAKL